MKNFILFSPLKSTRDHDSQTAIPLDSHLQVFYVKNECIETLPKNKVDTLHAHALQVQTDICHWFDFEKQNKLATNIFYPQEQYKIQSAKVLHTKLQVVHKLQLTCAVAEESLHSEFLYRLT